MNTFGLLISVAVLVVYYIDKSFLPRSAKVASNWMLACYLVLLLLIWFPQPFFTVSKFLGIGRPVDLFIYVSILILVREFFISRHRQFLLNRQLTDLAREIALKNVCHN